MVHANGCVLNTLAPFHCTTYIAAGQSAADPPTGPSLPTFDEFLGALLRRGVEQSRHALDLEAGHQPLAAS